MRNRFRKRQNAVADLNSIWSFVAADNEKAADKLLDRIGRALTMLAQNPQAGRERADLLAELRSFTVGNYTIFYFPKSDGIEVVRVLHGRQDIDVDDLA